MKKRPYFIEEDLPISPGMDLFLSQEMNNIIGDLLKPIQKFHPYNYKILLQNYYKVFSIPIFENASVLPIANYKPIPTWQKITRITVELIERCYLINKKDELFTVLYQALEAMGRIQKPEYFSSKELPGIIKLESLEDIDKLKDDTSNNLRKMLLHYHDLYDGSYKISLSFVHFLCDLLENNTSSKKVFKKYLEDDVSYKIEKINTYSSSIHLQDELNWLLIGADNHIRNAIAHKNWDFTGHKVKLYDKSGWNKELGNLEIGDIIKNMNLAIAGMQSGLLIGFSMYQQEISQKIPPKTHDIESIHSALYFFAREQSFLLDNININETIIYCELKEEIVGEGREIFMKNNNNITKIKLPEVGKISDRIMGLIFEACQVIWNYKKIVCKVFNWEGREVGVMEVNLEKFSELFFNKRNLKKEEFDSCIIRSTIT